MANRNGIVFHYGQDWRLSLFRLPGRNYYTLCVIFSVFTYVCTNRIPLSGWMSIIWKLVHRSYLEVCINYVICLQTNNNNNAYKYFVDFSSELSLDLTVTNGVTLDWYESQFCIISPCNQENIFYETDNSFFLVMTETVKIT